MSAEKSPPSPTLPEVIEGNFPGNADLWIGNPAARARRGLKGQSSYKAALGDFPLENEDNLLVTASWFGRRRPMSRLVFYSTGMMELHLIFILMVALLV